MAAFPPGQFKRAIPEDLIGDICMDYVNFFHLESRLCNPGDAVIRCIHMVDDMVRHWLSVWPWPRLATLGLGDSDT